VFRKRFVYLQNFIASQDFGPDFGTRIK